MALELLLTVSPLGLLLRVVLRVVVVEVLVRPRHHHELLHQPLQHDQTHAHLQKNQLRHTKQVFAVGVHILIWRNLNMNRT